jgi:crotonobetainyl-CoA:carnitine CoA-transferase CaiB-like acyl-CoA transferase
MAGKTLVPEDFGPLQGTKIVSTGTLIAQPYSAVLAAMWGAEVIQVEKPVIGDRGWRTIGIKVDAIDGGEPVSCTWIQERRNEFQVTLDFTKPEGRNLLLKLIERADIWMESSKPGTYGNCGLTDAEAFKVNPRLVIHHVSGYGQTGIPEYRDRASYDFIGQARGGIMTQTGFPETAPTRAAPWTGDYLTAYLGLAASLAALTYARATGKGQAIDLAQYEAIHATMGGTMPEYFLKGVLRERSGNKAAAFQPYDAFEAKDGWVCVGAVGLAVFGRACKAIGLDPDDPKWHYAYDHVFDPEGIEFDAIIRGWIAERTVAEVVKAFNDAKVGCTPVMTAKDMAEDPQYQARQVHIEWDDEQVGKAKGFGVIPKFGLTPGKIWRGSARLGSDNQRIYCGLLGLSQAELARLKEANVI